MASNGATNSARPTHLGWLARRRAPGARSVVITLVALAVVATFPAVLKAAAPTPGRLAADLELQFAAEPNPVTSGTVLTYRISVTNRGPDTAPGFVVRDSIPPQLTLQNANSSRGGVNHSERLLEWTMGSLPSGAGATLDIVVLASQPGTVTNTATVSLQKPAPRPASATATATPASSTTEDPADTNNSATVAVRILGGLTVENLATNGMTLDKESGVFSQRVAVHNDSGSDVAAARVLIQGLAPSVTVRNATGTDAGIPFLEVKHPIPPGALAELRIEYAVTNQTAPPFPRLEARNGAGTNNPASTASTSTASTNDAPTLSVRHVNGRLMLEFLSTPQRFYAIEYADVDRATGAKPWKRALSSIEIRSNSVQWIDDGPPKTDSLPTNRIYRLRVVETNAPAGTNSVSTNSAASPPTNSPAAPAKP